MGESSHIHTQTPRYRSQCLDRPRHMTVIAIVLFYPCGLLLHERDGAHDAVGGRVTFSGAGLRGHVRGAGAGGGRGRPCGGALAALWGSASSLVLGAASMAFLKALWFFGHVLHNLLRHLHSLKSNHVDFQKAVNVLFVSVEADSRQAALGTSGTFICTVNCGVMDDILLLQTWSENDPTAISAHVSCEDEA